MVVFTEGNMMYLGDITKIDGGQVRPVDVIIGGSPCQDLSIAGKRAGLAGERSGLYMEQIRIIKELRDADRERGRTGQLVRPRFMVWENVPGALSSNKGEDFRAVLEEAVKVVEPDAVIPGHASGTWRTSGAILGDGWSLAWRVLDAQFWGVPQRRRRIALVVDFGGHAAPEILFVRKSVSGNIEQVEAAGEATAAGVGGGLGGAVTVRIRGGREGGGKGALIQRERSGTLGCGNDQTLFCINDQGGGVMDVSVEKRGSLRAQEHGRQPIVAAFKGGQGAAAGGIGYAEEVSPALTGAASGSNRAPCVLSVAENQRHEVRTSEVCQALSTGGGKPGQGYPCVFENHGQDSRLTGPVEMAPTVARKFGTGGNNTPLIVSQQRFGEYAEGVGTLTSHNGTRHAGETLVVTGLDCRNGRESEEISHTLQAGGTGVSLNATHPVRVGSLVRRLTPLECERLQGYPDGWTDIGAWVDSKGKLHKESSDSARYKALGNSIALPPWRWVLIRLSALYERPATMGSLFDGIGGFPLLWERFNGPGSCLWASEIEEFPMAVTRVRFGDDGDIV